MCDVSKYFFQHLMVLCDFTAIWVLNTQGKRSYKGKGVWSSINVCLLIWMGVRQIGHSLKVYVVNSRRLVLRTAVRVLQAILGGHKHPSNHSMGIPSLPLNK